MLLSPKEQNSIHFLFSYSRVLSRIRNDSLVYLALFSIFLDSLSEMKQTFLKKWVIDPAKMLGINLMLAFISLSLFNHCLLFYFFTLLDREDLS